MTPPNRVALITAASRGMGAGIARRLSEDGFRLALMSRSDAYITGQNIRLDGGLTRSV